MIPFRNFTKISKKFLNRVKSFVPLNMFSWYKNCHWKVINNEATC